MRWWGNQENKEMSDAKTVPASTHINKDTAAEVDQIMLPNIRKLR